MKSLPDTLRTVTAASLPMRGEWIEIYTQGCHIVWQTCLSPCGESGLKYDTRDKPGKHDKSLPMRGEWIEIGTSTRNCRWNRVSPHAGRVD